MEHAAVREAIATAHNTETLELRIASSAQNRRSMRTLPEETSPRRGNWSMSLLELCRPRGPSNNMGDMKEGDANLLVALFS